MPGDDLAGAARAVEEWLQHHAPTATKRRQVIAAILVHHGLVAVVDLVQRYVPQVRQEAEIANFIATAQEAGARLALPDGTRTTALPPIGRTP